MNRKISFSLLCRWAFPISQGGVAMHNKNLIETLLDSMNIKQISLFYIENKTYFESIGVPFDAINQPKNIPHFLLKFPIINNSYRFFIDKYISDKMSNLILLNKPDIVEFMDINSEAFSFLKKNKIFPNNNIKVVIRAHTPWGLLRPYYNRKSGNTVEAWDAIEKEKFCFHQCNAITVPSNDLKSSLIEIYDIRPEKIEVIPNIVDVNIFKPNKNIVKDNKIFNVLHVGRFDESKGVVTLIKAFILLAKKHKNIILTNVGKIVEKTKINCQNILKKENLTEKVKFKRFIPYENLSDEYSKADVVVVPSEIYESFSYTVAQGMACEKIVIGSNIGGIPETLKFGELGKMFNPGDISELANLIEEVLINKNNYKIKEKDARKHIIENFSNASLKKRYLKFYQNLIHVKN